MNNNLIKNALIYTGSNVLTASIPLLLLPILTRALSPDDYGMVALFSLAVSIFGAFTGLNVQSALTVRYFQVEKSEFSGYVGTALGILFISTSSILTVAIIAGEYISSLTLIPQDWLIAAVITSGSQIAIQIRLAIWQVQHKALQYGSLSLTQSLVNAGLSLYLILVVNLAWQGRLIGLITSTTMFMVIGVYLLNLNNEVAKPKNFGKAAMDILKFGLPLIPHVIGAILLSSIDRFMISNFMGLTEAGIYTVAFQIAGAMSLLTGAINNAYSPWLMSKLKTKNSVIQMRIVKGTYGYFIFLLILALGISYAAPLLLLLVGEEFRGTGYLFIYIALGQAFIGMYLMLSSFILFFDKTGILSALTIITGIINVLAIYILIKVNGLMGVAQAFAFSMALRFFCAWFITQKLCPMPWITSLNPFKKTC